MFAYQLNKLKTPRAGDAQIVFVGDSSLGNAINSGEFGALAKLPATNLALTGQFGFAGSYNMVKRAVASTRVNTVVIMQTPDMMTRSQSMEGYLYTMSGAADLSELSADELLLLGRTAAQLFWSRDNLMSTIQGLLGYSVRLRLVNDYPAQAPRKTAIDADRRPLSLQPSSTENIRFLKHLKSFCLRHGINAVYAHGPILDLKLSASGEYIEATNKLIENAGFGKPVGPLAITAKEMGDSVDHVAPEFKRQFTAKYFEVLQSRLH